MKKLYFLTLLALLSLNTQAQCDGERYRSQVFSSFTKSTVTYSDTFQLKMDIYLPVGDSQKNRPTILLAHGGSFVAGDRNELTITKLCERFALRGYVTASMDYRLAPSFFDMIQEATATEVVVKSISDGKAALRYLKLKADSLGIDPQRIIVGGNSAGAVLMDHLAYLDSLGEVSKELVRNSIENNGGFDGNSGNPGPNSKVFAVIDWAGAILDTTWMSAGNVPVINLHGNPDNTVPYECGKALNGVSQVTLCGPGSYNKRLQNVGIPYQAKAYPGGGHQPWNDTTIFNEGDSLTTAFLYQLICGVSGIKTVATNAAKIYPNPSNDILTIEANQDIATLSLYDLNGRLISQEDLKNVRSTKLNIQNLPTGYYLLKLFYSNGEQSQQKVSKY